MAGTIGSFGGDLSSIGQMLDRRQNNAQFLRKLVADQQEQAAIGGREMAALALQRELGMGGLALDRDRFGLEGELGRGAQAISRDRLNLEGELGRGAQAQAGGRLALDRDLGMGGLGVAQARVGLDRDRMGLDRELGMGQLELGRGNLGLGQGRLDLDKETARRQLDEMVRQFDVTKATESEWRAMEDSLRRSMPAIEAEATLGIMKQQRADAMEAAKFQLEGQSRLGKEQRADEARAAESAARAQAIITSIAQGKPLTPELGAQLRQALDALTAQQPSVPPQQQQPQAAPSNPNDPLGLSNPDVWGQPPRQAPSLSPMQRTAQARNPVQQMQAAPQQALPQPAAPMSIEQWNDVVQEYKAALVALARYRMEGGNPERFPANARIKQLQTEFPDLIAMVGG